MIVKFDIRYEMIDPCRPIMAYVRKLFETGNGPDTEVYILEEDSRLVLFIGHDHENLPELREKTVIANEYVKAYQYCRISFGLSAAGGMAENLPGLYAEAISASELRRSRYNGIIRYDKTVPRIDYFRETEEKTGGWIRQALSEGSFDPLAQMLEERYAAFREKGAEYGYPLYLIGVIRIFEGMLTGSARARLEKPLGRLCWGIDNEQKLYKIRNEWQESFRELFDQYLVSKLKDENYHITKAQGYISQHFSEELSLQKVADEVHLNAVYFGNLFKSVTGVNFLEYVQLHRIEHAKELLTATDMRIEEVAESSGYRDKRYFSRIFKRIVGMSPGTYRKLYARRQ